MAKWNAKEKKNKYGWFRYQLIVSCQKWCFLHNICELNPRKSLKIMSHRVSFFLWFLTNIVNYMYNLLLDKLESCLDELFGISDWEKSDDEYESEEDENEVAAAETSTADLLEVGGGSINIFHKKGFESSCWICSVTKYDKYAKRRMWYRFRWFRHSTWPAKANYTLWRSVWRRRWRLEKSTISAQSTKSLMTLPYLQFSYFQVEVAPWNTSAVCFLMTL